MTSRLRQNVGNRKKYQSWWRDNNGLMHIDLTSIIDGEFRYCNFGLTSEACEMLADINSLDCIIEQLWAMSEKLA